MQSMAGLSVRGVMGPKWAFKTQTEGLNQQPLGVKHQTAPLHHSGKVSNSWFACVDIAAAPWYKDVFDTMSSCWSLCGPTVSLLTLDKGCGFKSQLMCSNQSANIRVRKPVGPSNPGEKRQFSSSFPVVPFSTVLKFVPSLESTFSNLPRTLSPWAMGLKVLALSFFDTLFL